MHRFANFECDTGHERASFITNVYVVERQASQVIKMKPKPVAVRVEPPAEQTATFQHMSDAVSRCLVKLHRER